MTSLMPRKRSFFSQDSSVGSSSSSSSSCDHLPMLVDNRHCESPPPSGGFAMDFGALNRIVPGRATSMGVVRNRSGMSLSPTKERPRKSISMFFGGSPSSSGTNGSISDSSVDYTHASNPYGMLNPGPMASRRNNQSTGNLSKAIAGIMATLTLFVLVASAYQHNARLNHELTIKSTEIEMHTEFSNELERRVRRMRSETLHLHSRIEELENPKPTEEELAIQRKVFHLEHYQEQLHKGIAAQSKRLLVEKYGPGPTYIVEIKLAFDPESNIVQDATTEIEDTIWVETASMEEMPHSVHFFLEQVTNGVYDNTAFYRNAPGFVQAGPGVDSRGLQKLELEQPSLAHILYQEHSPNLNHEEYTLGFPGRPGGPDFYLNLQDNSGRHGLGAGITHRSEFMIEADPCFARVVRGFNTLERIHRSNVQEEEGGYRRKQHRMVHPVTIVNMKVHHVENGQSQATER